MKRFLAAVCALLQAAAGLFCLSENSYVMSAAWLENEQALRVDLSLTYTNETGEKLDSVSFNVYANLFRRESALPYDNQTLEKAFPYGYAPSGIEFTGVYFNDVAARWRFKGENECFLSVDCALEPGEKGVFRFEYALLLSENRAFQGVAEDVRLTLFYPSACVYDGGFVYEPSSRAAPFLYSEPSDFELTLLLPEGFDPASGAEISFLGEENGYRTYRLTLKGASELGVTFSRRYRVYQGALPSGHVIRVLGMNAGDCKEALKEALRAGAACERFFGALDRTHTDVVFSSSALSQSLPGLILLGDDAEEGASLLLGRLMAEQYFGCSVLTDPGTDPFLRYGVSCYAALLSVEEDEGEAAFRKALRETIQPALKLTVPGSLTPDSSLSRFNTVYEFDLVAVRRGAAVLHELREVMGKDEMLRALSRYYAENKGRIAGIERFVAALDGERETSLGSALVAWLMTIHEYAQQTGDIY